LRAYLAADLALLLKTPLFSLFDVLALAPILNTVSTGSYAKGETIFHTGDPADWLFVVEPSRFDEVGIPAAQRCPAHWALTSCSAGSNVIGTIASSAIAESP
jgi:hypothetical protein